MDVRPVPELDNGQEITISTFSYNRCRVEVREEKVESRKHPVRRLLVDGVDRGEYDKWGGLPPDKLPGEFGSVKMTLSTGQNVELYEHDLTVITMWHSGIRRYLMPWQRDIYYFPEKKLLWQSRTMLNPWSAVTWAMLADLPLGRVVGATVGREFPFQWVKERLTNGEVGFPQERPTGSAWRHYPIYAVPARGWEFFLQALEKRFMRELIPTYHRACSVAEEAELEERRARKTSEDGSELRRVIEGKMWAGCPAAERIAVGSAVVWVVRRPEHLGTAYVVDNPDVGSAYFFSSYEEARDLASGLTPRSEIRPTQLHVDHVLEWEKEVDVILENVPANRFAGTPTANGVARLKKPASAGPPEPAGDRVPPPADNPAQAGKGEAEKSTSPETSVTGPSGGKKTDADQAVAPAVTEPDQPQTKGPLPASAPSPPPKSPKGGGYSLFAAWGPPK